MKAHERSIHQLAREYRARGHNVRVGRSGNGHFRLCVDAVTVTISASPRDTGYSINNTRQLIERLMKEGKNAPPHTD